MDMDQIIYLDYFMIIPLFIIGSLMHFVFEWSKHNRKLAIIAAVNESYWEHLKIAFWPVFTLYLFEFILGGWNLGSFIVAKTISLYVIVVFMIGSVFTYKAITKKNVLLLDVVLFGVTILIAQVIGTSMLHDLNSSLLLSLLSIIFLLFIMVAFLRFTTKPPKEPDIFMDPITKKYGLKGHK